MPTLLLKLKNVPEDEYVDICELLDQNDIGYYETNVGFWGIGMSAIWLQDGSQLGLSHKLLNDYMQQRQVKAKAVYEQALQEGEARTLYSTFKQQPLMFVLYLLAVVLILGLTVMPFLKLM